MTGACDNKPTILVVDDSRLMRVAARKILKNDFEILEAEDGEVAWETLQDNRHITLVMSDLSMPNLDGLGLLKRIRCAEQDDLKDLPVIIVTGAEDDDGSKTTALAAGASDFITKPFESVQLLARAQAQVRQQRTRQALQDSESSKQQLEQQIKVDPLTSLANQQAFADKLEENLSYAIRHDSALAVLLVQIDKYKILFLRRGKQTAESILCRVAGILQEGRRREDTVARIGLDSFGVLLPSANPEGAARIARQLHAVIGQANLGNDTDTISVSIAASSPAIHSDLTPEQILLDAREKLKLALAAGGNCVQPTEAAPAKDKPVAEETPQPAAEQARATAEPADVQRALQALANGLRPETGCDDLVQAILPLLEAWNQSHDNRYSALLRQLEAALRPEQTGRYADTATL
ncbi:MAG TPA: response regulator [Gammaproteobacteria bacterium]|nr:response regulator [Gammaproteobacteria bacterium]